MGLRESITLSLAAWGAVVSTVALTWNIFRDVHKRARVRVDAMIGKNTAAPFGPEYLAVKITNVGGSSVMVQALAAEEGEKDARGKFRSHVLNAVTLPRMLDPKAYTVESVRDFSFVGPKIKSA